MGPWSRWWPGTTTSGGTPTASWTWSPSSGERARAEAPVRTMDEVDVEGRRVLVRVDFNVPLDGDRVTDDTRIQASLPTIQALRERGARLILASHLGRPRDREPELSLRPAAARLAELIGAEVQLAPAVVGEEVEAL